MGIEKIIIGIFTAIILIFIRHANLKAQKQKSAAIRLRSYLIYWQSVIIEKDFFNIFYMGIKWNEEADALLKKGKNSEGLINLEKEKKVELEGLKEHFLAEFDVDSFKKELHKIEEKVKKLQFDATQYVLELLKVSNQNLIDGKTFITDEEASYLGPSNSINAITLKMKIIDFSESFVGILLNILSDPSGFNLEELSDDVTNVVWKGIVVSKHIDTLTKRMNRTVNQSLLSLTFENFIDWS